MFSFYLVYIFIILIDVQLLQLLRFEAREHLLQAHKGLPRGDVEIHIDGVDEEGLPDQQLVQQQLHVALLLRELQIQSWVDLVDALLQ